MQAITSALVFVNTVIQKVGKKNRYLENKEIKAIAFYLSHTHILRVTQNWFKLPVMCPVLRYDEEILANHNLMAPHPRFGIFLSLAMHTHHIIPRKVHSNLDYESERMYDSSLGSIPAK